MTNDMIFMNELFSVIRHKKKEIKELEDTIRPNFEKNVIEYLKEKGHNFQLVDNVYDPINRYVLPERNPLFVWTPRFNITPWEFTIKFEWWKESNQNPTAVYWHPEEMNFEEFYNKKLKRAFKLL